LYKNVSAKASRGQRRECKELLGREQRITNLGLEQGTEIPVPLFMPVMLLHLE